MGDIVKFDYAGIWDQGPIIDARIGYKGDRLLRLRLDMPYGADPMFVTRPESDLLIVRRRRKLAGRSRARAA